MKLLFHKDYMALIEELEGLRKRVAELKEILEWEGFRVRRQNQVIANLKTRLSEHESL